MERRSELIHGSEEVRSISDINVTPFIDVMLVLLIIFMVTAPLMMGGVKINLPKTTDNPMPRPENPLIVSLDADNQVFVDKDLLAEGVRAETFRRLALESESGEIFVRGDGEVKYAKMIELMSELGQAGFARVTLVTSVQPGAAEAGGSAGASPAGASPDGLPSTSDGAAPSPASETASPAGTSASATDAAPASSASAASPAAASPAAASAVSPAAASPVPSAGSATAETTSAAAP
jgi:biopolymer transport protein ExbD